MLTAEENTQLTRVGPGTLMGELMRRYWIPVVQSSEVAAGGRPKRVRILAEDLIAYRNPGGRAAVCSEFCAHRRASLYFARNEERGLRCVYHGWQYGLDGGCIDMPNERPESTFSDKFTLPTYPCAERGGVVWTYMGPASPTPGLPDLEWALVPDDQRFVSKFWQGCNYLQALEGGVDPAHISFLHGILNTRDEAARRVLDGAAAGFGFAAQLERAPHIEVADTPTGLLLGARREAPAGQYYWRITQYLLPFHTMPPPEVGDDPLMHAHVWIPMDDDRGLRRHPPRRRSCQQLSRRLGGAADAEVLRRARRRRAGQGHHREPGRLRSLARASGPRRPRHHPCAQASARRGHGAAHTARGPARTRSRGLPRTSGFRAAREGDAVGGGREGSAGRALKAHRMGTFFTEAQLAAATRPDRREAVKLLVDSGSCRGARCGTRPAAHGAST